MYHERDEQRNHAQDALIRQLGNWLALRGVTELVVDRLDDVRERHWSAEMNEKTDLFWAHGRFRNRLAEVLEPEYGITVREESEAGTSSRCPACGSDDVHRGSDLLQCVECGREGYADLAGRINFLHDQTDRRIQHSTDDCGWPMARPAAHGQNSAWDGYSFRQSERGAVTCLEWNDHRWIPTDVVRGRERRGHGLQIGGETNEAPADRSTRHRTRNVVSEGAGTRSA